MEAVCQHQARREVEIAGLRPHPPAARGLGKLTHEVARIGSVDIRFALWVGGGIGRERLLIS